MKKNTKFFAALAASFLLALTSAFAQPSVTPPLPTLNLPNSTTSSAMACAADRLFVAEVNLGIWQVCTAKDGGLIGMPMIGFPNVAQLHHQPNGTLTSYGTDGLLRQYSVTHGQPYTEFRGDWPVQQSGRITAVEGSNVSIVFPWNYHSGQITLYNGGNDFGYFNRPQSEPFYVLAARNSAGLYGVTSAGELYHHEVVFGSISKQSTLVTKGVVAISAPSPASSTLYVAVQAQFDCQTTPSVGNGCRLIQPGSILKVKFDRWSASPYTVQTVVSGAYPAAMAPNTTLVSTETSVYFVENHPTAGSRVIGYSSKGGSGITMVIDKNSGLFRNSQGDVSDPWISAIVLAANQ